MKHGNGVLLLSYIVTEQLCVEVKGVKTNRETSNMQSHSFLLKLGRKPKTQACEIHMEDVEDGGGHVWVCILFSQR